jgi:serine protease inhibitor
MGIRTIFKPESQLKLIEGDENMIVSKATQQSSLEVNESGSIGASVTTFSIVALSVQIDHDDVEFHVDRPFAAIIIDRKYSVPYFMAKITNPRY